MIMIKFIKKWWPPVFSLSIALGMVFIIILHCTKDNWQWKGIIIPAIVLILFVYDAKTTYEQIIYFSPKPKT